MSDRESLGADQLAAYFALMEVSGHLRHAVEQQLRASGDLSYVQFQILARLNDTPDGRLRMTDLADGLVYSRSGITYQAGQLEHLGLIERLASADDERSTIVSVTPAGRALLQKVLPGHIEVVRERLLDALSPRDLRVLTDVLGRVRDRMRATPPRSAAPRSRRGVGHRRA